MIQLTYYFLFLALWDHNLYKAYAQEETKKENIITKNIPSNTINTEKSLTGDEALLVKRGYSSLSSSNHPLLKLPPMRVPVIQNGTWIADLFCRIECEIKDTADSKQIIAILPSLVDEAYTTLYRTLGENFIVQSHLEVGTWRILMKKSLNKYAPINKVYFNQFFLVEYRHPSSIAETRTKTKS